MRSIYSSAAEVIVDLGDVAVCACLGASAISQAPQLGSWSAMRRDEVYEGDLILVPADGQMENWTLGHRTLNLPGDGRRGGLTLRRGGCK
jgi:hypothetical protein